MAKDVRYLFTFLTRPRKPSFLGVCVGNYTNPFGIQDKRRAKSRVQCKPRAEASTIVAQVTDLVGCSLQSELHPAIFAVGLLREPTQSCRNIELPAASICEEALLPPRGLLVK
jgi:hypothetical protein